MKDPIWPIIGRMAGNGSVGEGVNETWSTGVVFMIEWIVVRLYTAELVSFERICWLVRRTLMFVSVNSVMPIFWVFK